MRREASARVRWRAAAAGVAAVLLAAGLGELAAAVIAPSASPFAVIGGGLIDIAPSWAKDLAIALFGTADKAALLTGMAVVAALIAAAAGLLELQRRPLGALIFVALGVIGAVVATMRTEGNPLAWLPSIVAGVAGAIVLRVLMKRTIPAAEDPADGPGRRQFLAWTGATAALGVAALVLGNLARATVRTVEAARAAVRLPAATTAAPAVPATAELAIAGLAPVVTPNSDFYRIDTALVVPQVDPADWSLRVHGMVDHEVVLTWDELLALPLQESDITLACVSNTVGGDLIGNARWLGYPVRELLA
ncbi:molybdopterin-dependent oxidoreductase, partial [Microbacterium sp.]|uniref:molybdopterin-dependent oxidoreductase n=1 Tax=Microbacterium sp. TaxID=51671 RepID=UPI00273666F4